LIKDVMLLSEETAFEVRDKIARSPFDERSVIPKINLDASKDSMDSPPAPIHKPAAEQGISS
jgi:hypothetical protein